VFTCNIVRIEDLPVRANAVTSPPQTDYHAHLLSGPSANTEAGARTGQKHSTIRQLVKSRWPRVRGGFVPFGLMAELSKGRLVSEL
jgi:hypothetical protein